MPNKIILKVELGFDYLFFSKKKSGFDQKKIINQASKLRHFSFSLRNDQIKVTSSVAY